MGFLKGKSAISIAGIFMGKKRNFTDQSFWARGYYASSIGLDKALNTSVDVNDKSACRCRSKKN